MASCHDVQLTVVIIQPSAAEFPLYSFPTAPLSPQMKDHTRREARSPGEVTNHICPGGAAFQVRYSQTWLHAMLFSICCPIPATAPNSPVSSTGRRVVPYLTEIFLSVCTRGRASPVFCLMLRCFECLRKGGKALVWHTCHWY